MSPPVPSLLQHPLPKLPLTSKRMATMRVVMTNAMASSQLRQANTLLCASEVQQALEIYTEVLTNSAPGHPAAFMNRSLCYIALDQPRLAVMDAERALIGATEAETGPAGNEQKKQVVSYARECQRAKQVNEPWTRAPSCFLPPKDLRTNLARLAISFRARTNLIDGMAEAPDPVHDLKMKAVYRLAYALWRCGGGAIRDALLLLDAGMEVGWKEDKMQFEALGNEMLYDLSAQFDAGRMAARGDVQDERTLRGLLRTRFTLERSTPHKDDRAKEDDGLERLSLLNECIRKVSCSAPISLLKLSESAERTLVATEDIFAGGCVFADTNSLQVSTASVEAGQMVLCDSCGTLLDVSETLLVGIYREAIQGKPPQAEPPPHEPVPLTPPELAGLDVDEYLKSPPPVATPEPDQQSRQSPITSPHFKKPFPSSTSHYHADDSPPTPPPHKQLPRRSLEGSMMRASVDVDIQLCKACEGGAIFCSQACYHLGMRTHHLRTCNLDLEEYLRASNNRAEHALTPKPHLQLLKSLLLLRLISWAENAGKSLGDLPVVQLLKACARDPDEKATAWSYESHVVRPLQLYHAIDDEIAPRSALDPGKSDGAIINEVLNLIEQSMQVHQGPRWTKIYNEDGELVHTDRNDHEPVIAPTDSRGNAVWCASLHPLCDLIAVAAPDDASHANVELVDVGNGTLACVPLASSTATAATSPDSSRRGSSLSVNKAYGHLSLASQPGSPRHADVAPPCIAAGTAVVLGSRTPRPATERERRGFQALFAAGAGAGPVGGSARGSSQDVNMSGGSASGSDHVDIADTMMAYEELCSDDDDGGGLDMEDGQLDDEESEVEGFMD